MSDKKLNIDASESKSAENAEDYVTEEVNNANNSVQSDEHCNNKEIKDPKTKDNKSVKNDNIKNTTYDASQTNDTKTEEKRKLSDSNVVDYLKSEFVGLNTKDVKGMDETEKLPKYTEIDMTGYSRKYIDKHTKVWKYSKGKRHRLFLKEPVVVQIMGSENLPENKVAMVYEPEIRNYTVKGMFVMLMLMHLFTWFFTFILWQSPTREVFLDYGLFICVIPFFILILIVIAAACLKCCRNACTICCNLFWVMFIQSIGCASFSGYFNVRIFIYAYLALVFTDIVCIIVGCFNFDFTSKKLYIIELTSAFFFLMGIIPTLSHVFINNVGYWDEELYNGENMISHICNFIFTFAVVILSVAELHLLLGGEWIEIGEDDYSFGGFLMYVAPLDFPLRILRKRGAFKRCEGDDEEEEEE